MGWLLQRAKSIMSDMKTQALRMPMHNTLCWLMTELGRVKSAHCSKLQLFAKRVTSKLKSEQHAYTNPLDSIDAMQLWGVVRFST